MISWNLGPETVPSKTLVPSHPYDLDFRTVFLAYRPSPMEEAAVGGCAIISLPVAMIQYPDKKDKARGYPGSHMGSRGGGTVKHPVTSPEMPVLSSAWLPSFILYSLAFFAQRPLSEVIQDSVKLTVWKMS